jgi:hypothetical protein
MFPSQDPEYDNVGDDAGKNDDIGSDVTPMADNFDRSEPLYRTIAALARLRAAHPALADGAQQTRFSSPAAGVFAFSRTEARERVEYLVALNNATTARTATIPTYSAHMPFKRLWGDGPRRLHSGADRSVTLTVPGLSAVVLRAAHRLKRPKAAPGVSLQVDPQVSGRPEVRADVDGTSLYETTFYARRAGTRDWTSLGTDDNAPYRVFPDLSAYAPGTHLELLAVVRDVAGHVATARAATEDVAPPTRSAGTAIIHYHRADGNYAGWGLHLWGDAIAEGVGTSWDAPRMPTRFDDFGAVFEIPLADPAASLNYIIHQPSGDSVPATREPGGDRSFVPAVSPEVWVVSGDPTIHTSPPGP